MCAANHASLREVITPFTPAAGTTWADTASAIPTSGQGLAPSTTAQLGVQVVVDGPVLLATATRYSDTSPFNAGGLMDANGSLSKCTSGFAICNRLEAGSPRAGKNHKLPAATPTDPLTSSLVRQSLADGLGYSCMAF